MRGCGWAKLLSHPGQTNLPPLDVSETPLPHSTNDFDRGHPDPCLLLRLASPSLRLCPPPRMVELAAVPRFSTLVLPPAALPGLVLPVLTLSTVVRPPLLLLLPPLRLLSLLPASSAQFPSALTTRLLLVDGPPSKPCAPTWRPLRWLACPQFALQRRVSIVLARSSRPTTGRPLIDWAPDVWTVLFQQSPRQYRLAPRTSGAGASSRSSLAPSRTGSTSFDRLPHFAIACSHCSVSWRTQARPSPRE